MKNKKRIASKYQFREAKSGKLVKVEMVCGGGYGRPRCLRTRDLLKLMPCMGGGYGKPQLNE